MIFIGYDISYAGFSDYFKANVKKLEDEYNQYLQSKGPVQPSIQQPMIQFHCRSTK